MGGDLNLKKSWHPVLMSNQRRVWEEEKKALEERKRTEQRVKELKEERAKEEIQQKLEAAGSRKRIDRVDWMYQGPSSGQAGTTEEMEGYLLGKRRIDGLIKGNDNRKLEKQAAEDSFMALQNANTLRDTAAKIREDPLLAIKKQEQAAYESMMNDPIKRRQLMAVIGGQTEQLAKSKERKHRRHHHRQRDGSDDERKSKRRRRDGDDRGGGRSSHRRRRRSVSYSSDSRTASPVRARRDDDRRGNRDGSRHRRRRSDSVSSEGRSPSSDRRRNSYPAGRNERDHRDDRSKRGRQETGRDFNGDRRAWANRGRTELHLNGGRDEHVAEQRSGGAVKVSYEPAEDKEADRQRKLAAMQQDASSLDQDRERRLEALAEREKAEREIEEMARARSSKYGTKGDFIHGVHRKAGDMSLGDRMGRSNMGFQRDED